MDTMTNILRILTEQGKSQKDLADHLGVSTGKISDWKAGRISSYTKHISKIAEYLGVSTDTILGTPAPADKEKAPRPMTEREKREQTIMELFKQLPPGEQAVILRQAQWMVAQQEQEQDKPDADK